MRALGRLSGRVCLSLGVLVFLSQLHAAPANGQSTHLWITDQARTHLLDGTLADLLAKDSAALRIGTMFPDGGYAVSHDYGEVAHWEPFQNRFRNWIRATYPDLSASEAGPYVAFYMGLASHGMADQVFDSMYLERSKVYDAEGWEQPGGLLAGLDTSQDVIFVNLTGKQALPELWLPEVLPSIYAEAGIDVDMEKLKAGQQMLQLAVGVVSSWSANPDEVAKHRALFPWGCSHLLDSTAGAPPMEAEIVAKYWQTLWAELQGEVLPLTVIGHWPSHGMRGVPHDPLDIEAMISVVFSKGMYQSAINSKVFHVKAGFEDRPLDLDLFYLDNSHVVNVAPTKSGCQAVLVTVGSHEDDSVETKSVTAPDAITSCPRIVNKSNWEGGHTYDDVFDVEVSNGQVHVDRRNDIGWGLDLRFNCDNCAGQPSQQERIKGWLERADHALIVDESLESTDGRAMQVPFQLHFSTKATTTTTTMAAWVDVDESIRPCIASSVAGGFVLVMLGSW